MNNLHLLYAQYLVRLDVCGGRINCFFTAAVFCLVLLCPLAVSAEAVTDTSRFSSVVINEVQTNGIGTGKTGEEFVELVNISNSPVAMDGWKLQYISSTGNMQTADIFASFPAGFVINPNASLLVCPQTFMGCSDPALKYTISSSFAGLGSTGGSVALLNSLGQRFDLVGWGSNALTKYETAAATLPPDGQSIQRKTVNNQAVDTNNNLLDFEVLKTPTPLNSNKTTTNNSSDEDQDPTPTPTPTPVPTPTPMPSPTPTPEPEPSPTPTPTPTPTPPPIDTKTNNEASQDDSNATAVAPDSAQTILLNELYIDPVSPEVDSKDEWIELYNPNDTAQNLMGYTVYAGETFAYHHTFMTSTIIEPHGYVTISSADTSIALANTGGAAKIVSPSGQFFDQVAYQTAKPGLAWAKNSDGVWQWTTSPTRGAQNVINISSEKVAAISAPPPISTKTPTKITTKTPAEAVKKATVTPKPTVAKTTTTANTTKVKAATSEVEEPAVVAAPSPLPLWLLATLGTLAVLYSVYEYRFEIANRIYQFRQYRAARKPNR